MDTDPVQSTRYVKLRDQIVWAWLVFIILFGSWAMFAFLFPLGFVVVGVTVAALNFFKNPLPDDEIVERVFGKELHVKDPGFKLKTFAHRGLGYDAPENSLEAFKLCKENGILGVECDISLTADNVPIMFHDNDLERVSGVKMVIARSKWEDISKVDISLNHPFRDRYPNTHIPTLDEAVRTLLSNEQHIILDLKDYNNKLVDVVINLYEKYPELYRRAAVSSFFPNLIYMIRHRNPKIVGCLAWRPYFFSHDGYAYGTGPGNRRYKQFYKHYIALFINILYAWVFNSIVYSLLGISAVLLHRDAISGETVMKWKSRGVRVICWSINTPVEKQFYARHLKITYLTDTVTGENSTHQGPSS